MRWGVTKDIAAQIVDQGADYVLALKGNQGTIHTNVKTFFDQRHEQQQNYVPEGGDRPETLDETINGDHGRIEIRRYQHMTDLSW